MRYFESVADVKVYLTNRRDEHESRRIHYQKLANADKRRGYEPSKRDCEALVVEHNGKRQAYDDALAALNEIRPDMAQALRETIGVQHHIGDADRPAKSYEDRIRASGRGSAHRAGDF